MEQGGLIKNSTLFLLVVLAFSFTCLKRGFHWLTLGLTLVDGKGLGDLA